MKNLLLSITVCGIIACGCAQAKELKTIQLNAPDTQRGDAVMTALKNRKSTREFSTKELSLKDLSDLCWAANASADSGENVQRCPEDRSFERFLKVIRFPG